VEPITQADRPQANRVRITGEITVQNATEVHHRFAGAVERAGDLLVDLSQVESCDTAGLQLICSLRKAAIASGCHLRLESLSSAIRDAAGGIGLPLAELTGPEGVGDGL